MRLHSESNPASYTRNPIFAFSKKTVNPALKPVIGYRKVYFHEQELRKYVPGQFSEARHTFWSGSRRLSIAVKFLEMKLRILLFLCLLLPVWQLTAQVSSEGSYADSISQNLVLLKRYLAKGDDWHFTNSEVEKRLSGLISFIENEPIDTLIRYFSTIGKEEGHILVNRLPEHVPDSLQVQGYIPFGAVSRRLQAIQKEVENDFTGRPFQVPGELLDNMDKEISLIPEGEGMRLFSEGIYSLPDSLRILDALPENMVQSPEDFRRILRLEEVRRQLAERKRVQYNDSLIQAYKNKVALEYRQQLINSQVKFLSERYTDSVRIHNYQVLRQYNDQVTRSVNDSLRQAIGWVADFADMIDYTTVKLINLTDEESPLVLSNTGKYFTRVWLKNRQNDSISVLVQNVDKRSMQLVIEDGYTFSRFRQQAVKDFDFASLNRPTGGLDKVSSRFQAVTPWTIGGDGNVGFTQTHLSNWKKGGKSAMSILLVGRGYANYSLDKVKWENSAEIRNGWIKPGEEMIQKNDDKFRVTSRLGLSAFQKWYYSTEADFETQFFNGYKYPNTDRAISAFLAPGRFMAKVGLDYKPHKDFSLFISPITSKTVFVIDTVKIDQTAYGIEKLKKLHWEPGFSTDLRFKKDFVNDITYETKFRMFVNYLEPTDRFEMDWENLLTMQLTQHIALRASVHTIYDTKVLFDRLDKEGNPVLDNDGKKIREPKLQLREFVTIGFSYKINRRVVRAREVK